MGDSYDAAVIGAGVFGAWIAYRLRRSGRSVALLDAYGPANSRASSGDESRILRMGYAAEEIYTRWAMRSRQLWIEFFESVGQPELFVPTGALWTPPPGDLGIAQTMAAFERCGAPFEFLKPAELPARFPQFAFSSERIGIFEPWAGALYARRAVRAVVEEAVRNGVDYFRDAAEAPDGGEVRTKSGNVVRAGAFVYACGPWLPQIFPEILEGRIRVTRQEVFYFGPPAGNRQFAPPAMPAWIDFSSGRGEYVVPDLENRGLKVGFDRHGPAFDPDFGERIARYGAEVRTFVAERFPALAGAPIVESRVCQYENTGNGDFLIDRHPQLENVWLAGGGSGHGFKHGPMVGEYVTGLLDGAVEVEPRFSLDTKSREPRRSVY
ncbi:MAG TPA: FAD-dependent oxidoreductase [Bryobacteraceae bacterium]